MRTRDLAAMGLLVGIATLAGDVRAATFTVTTTADTPGGVCDGASCTLREAIFAANITPGADDVSVPAGNYMLTLGQLDISDDLTVTGAGSGNTVIDGNASSRVIEISGASAVTAALVNVSISNGSTGVAPGGCILNSAGHTLTLTDTVVSGCASSGGGIHNDGTLTLTDTVVTGCTVGGGIFSGGTLTVTGSAPGLASIDNNQSFANAGGLAVGVFGIATLDNVSVSHNDPEGILASGSLTVDSSLIEQNVFAGIRANDPLTIRDSTVRNNGTVGIQVNSPSGVISGTTISGQSLGVEVGGAGGLAVFNSTISGNATSGIQAAALSQFTGSVDVSHSTIAENGMGLDSSPGGTFAVTYSIVAGNSVNCSAPVRSLGHNLDDDGSCGLGAPGDLSNVADAGLGPLADYGGPTDTHSLMPGSPAIDAGRAFDQRGAPLQDGDEDTVIAPDIGAYELPEPMAAVMMAGGALLLIFLRWWRVRRGA
jgi:CSLREA domain-containing protein